ncbi:MAG: hypothetical protein O3B31_09565 [Chloroflexi bacterium]|nr:hypothetical protein [Chloroflexota bacterium]
MSVTTPPAEAPPAPRRVRVPREGPLDPEQGVEAFRRVLERGEEWYPALLSVIARWSHPREELDGTAYQYLIGGEAFDWLLLAERLLSEATDLVPLQEAERLLLFGIAPDAGDDESFEAAIGTPKYRAHLNFQYGVVVEELLLLSVEQEYQKAGRLVGSGQAMPDVAAYDHVYGKSLEELIMFYRSESDMPLLSPVSQKDWQAFTYWCSKYRVRNGEPARVASDTRKAVALMSRLESGRVRLGRMRPERFVKVRVRA